MMPILRGLAPLLLLLGCAQPAVEPAAPSVPPAVTAVPEPPAVTLAPRAAWRRIPIDRRGGIAAAFAASEVLHWAEGVRRVWIVLNLAEPIRLPETGRGARSVAFLADYRCGEQSWAPIEGAWYRGTDAQGLEFEEKPRHPEERGVQPGTLIAIFLEAACRL
jgi:hypothetical protein